MEFKPDIRNNTSGFTLIEMAMVMIIAGIILSTIMTVLPSILRTAKIKETRALLDKYNYALQGYASANLKLPYADSNGDGKENTGCYIGTLPYITLGLSNGNDAWGHLVKYAVYNNLAAVTPNPSYCCFCKNIQHDITTGFNSSFVHSTSCDKCDGSDDTNSVNKAYIIASGGGKDLDGQNGFFDLYNRTASSVNPRFNADNKIQTLSYDDVVKSMPLSELSSLMKCPASGTPPSQPCGNDSTCPY